jgi:hypothetical protein
MKGSGRKAHGARGKNKNKGGRLPFDFASVFA